MKQSFFIKLDKAGYVRDIITYEHEGFEEIEYDDVLPVGILGGFYKWENGQFVVDSNRKAEMDVVTQDSSVVDLTRRLNIAEAANKRLAKESTLNQIALMELHAMILRLMPEEEVNP